MRKTKSFENWNKLPLGYLIDLYWNPKTDKIKYNGDKIKSTVRIEHKIDLSK